MGEAALDASRHLLNLGELDEEHEVLRKLLLKLLAAIEGSASRKFVLGIAHEVQNHALLHFFSEEKYMREMKYPGLSDHIELHIGLITSLSEKLSELEIGNCSVTEMQHFLDDWLTQHMLQEDAKFIAFVSTTALSNT